MIDVMMKRTPGLSQSLKPWPSITTRPLAPALLAGENGNIGVSASGQAAGGYPKPTLKTLSAHNRQLTEGKKGCYDQMLV
jgi:hypothetical protein